MTSPDNDGGASETSPAAPLDRVGELLREREQYDQWIAALEAKKDRTPPHVYDRVRGDYERRRKEVIAEITGHSSELRQALEQARERCVRLEQQEKTRRDERAEMELRHLVGEYTEEQWRVLSTKTDTEINQLAEAREAAQRALAQLEEVVRVATPAEVRTVSGSGAGSPDAGPPAESGAAAPGAGVSPQQFDELAFLKSVVGPQKGSRGSLPATPPVPDAAFAPTAPPPPTQPAAPPEPAAPVRYATPVGQMPLQPPLPPPQPAVAGRITPPPQPRVPSEPAPAGAGADARPSPETGKVPAFLKDVPKENVKTLRCQECGTMNFPTEWYCERCGGEMAAM